MALLLNVFKMVESEFLSFEKELNWVHLTSLKFFFCFLERNNMVK